MSPLVKHKYLYLCYSHTYLSLCLLCAVPSSLSMYKLVITSLYQNIKIVNLFKELTPENASVMQSSVP